MTFSKSIFIATFTLVATLAGCSGTMPPAAAPVASAADAGRVVPVYIIPNCQALAGKRYCMWLEPRGYQSPAPIPAPAATDARRIDGIAL